MRCVFARNLVWRARKESLMLLHPEGGFTENARQCGSHLRRGGQRLRGRRRQRRSRQAGRDLRSRRRTCIALWGRGGSRRTVLKPGDKELETITSSRVVGDVVLCSGGWTYMQASGAPGGKGYWTKVVGKVGNDWKIHVLVYNVAPST